MGPKKGAPSGNPRGKNPSDVWDIPNVKANHVEKTAHPCQFPVALPQMFTRALTNTGDLIFDPFSGSGTTGVAALIEQRRFVGAEIDSDYIEIARERMSGAINGTVAVRPWDKAIHVPDKNTKVATPPDEFITIQGLDIQQHTGLRSL
ncbi:DNA-methyltransferase [Burkholderia vietnamiensis]|uniref:DNA-methyltransferase n=1 Tax=Burkholderia vietnamiensis TaxID=60552 RepID=UPI003D2FE988